MPPTAVLRVGRPLRQVPVHVTHHLAHVGQVVIVQFRHLLAQQLHDAPARLVPDRLARAIASDLSLYNEEKITQGISDDNLFDALAEEIEEGRQLFKSRVTTDIFDQQIYDRALVDVLIKSKGHVKSKIW